MTALEFDFSQVNRELEALKTLTRRFLWSGSGSVLDDVQTSLLTMRAKRPTGVVKWEISQANPLKTIATQGYERKNKGPHEVFAEITFVWDIKVVPAKKKSMSPARFQLADQIASTRVRLLQGRPERPGSEVAMWRMELGDTKAPGCCLHTQVMGELSFPTMVIEFVLAELFQEEWAREVGRASDALNAWRAIQAPRLSSILEWHKGLIGRAEGSPWVLWKAANPPQDLLA
jgi:hypothetical protein